MMVQKPVVFRDGDLVFVTLRCRTGNYRSKASIGPYDLGEAANKLASNIEMVRLHPNNRAFSALFAFESETDEFKSVS